MDMLTHIFSPFLPGYVNTHRIYCIKDVYTCNTVMGNYRPINGYVNTHIFTFSTCRIYCIKDRPINGYAETHIFTFSTCRIYCIKDVYTW